MTTEWFSEIGPFMHLSNHVFRSLWDSFFIFYFLFVYLFIFSKCWKFNVSSKNTIKNQQNVFRFLDNYIWIGSSKLSLLWQKCSSSAIKVLMCISIVTFPVDFQPIVTCQCLHNYFVSKNLSNYVMLVEILNLHQFATTANFRWRKFTNWGTYYKRCLTCIMYWGEMQ